MILYVSFTTRPGTGSEGGVGWQFLKAYGEYARRTNQQVLALIDARDEAAVSRALSQASSMSHVKVVAARVPWPVRNFSADRRTRMSYIAWYFVAQRIARRIASTCHLEVVHQTTFATASLPPVLPKRASKRFWGPVAIPEASIEQQRFRYALESIAIAASRLHARFQSRKAHITLAQNDYTFASLRKWARPTRLEPNIVVADDSTVDESKCPRTPYFVICGLLIDRKRPWVALESFSDPRFSDMELVVAGSGPLEEELQREYAGNRAGLGSVRFLGRVSHEEAMGLLRNARALLHPAKREGAPWVVGEALSFGTPVILLGDSGASAVLRLSGGLGCVVPDTATSAEDIVRYRNAMLHFKSAPKKESGNGSCQRWSESRLPQMLADLIDDTPNSRSGNTVTGICPLPTADGHK